MRYVYPHIRKIAQGINFLCAAYFVAFSFLFLFCLQSDLLTQVKYQMSSSEDSSFSPFWAATLCTLILWSLGVLLKRLLHWLPLRRKALIWFVPFLLLAFLTHWRFPQYGDSGTMPSPLYLVLYVIIYIYLLLRGYAHIDSSKEHETFSTYAWPNVLLLILMSCMSISFSNTDIVMHRTLRAASQLADADYDGVLETARYEQHPSQQLSAMTALALSNRGELGEHLFAYPQPFGSEGLLPQLADTALFFNLPLAAGNHIGYKRGPRSRVSLFLEVISTMPKAKPSVRDYRLAAALLDRDLPRFASILKSDTASVPMPIHYREAMLLHSYLTNDSTIAPADSFLTADFQEFRLLLDESGTKDEREFRCRNRFGATYWTYFYFH